MRGRYANGNYHSDHEIQILSGASVDGHVYVRCTCGWSHGEGGDMSEVLAIFGQHKKSMRGDQS